MIRKILRSIWLLFCWGTLSIVVLAAVAGVCALYQINTHIRQHVLKELEKQFPDLEIAIGKVHLDEQKGISIHDLECSIPGRPGRPRRALFAADELYLQCPVTIQSLYRKEVRIRKTVLKNPIIRLARNTEGGFEELKYLRGRESSVRPAPIEVHNGLILYEDAGVPRTMPLKITGISLLVTPPESDRRPVLLSDLENRDVPPGAWKVSGDAKGDQFRQLNFEGYFDPSSGRWEASANCRQFDWTADLLDYIPIGKPLLNKPEYQQSLESFLGRFDFELQARSDAQAPRGFRFSVNGVLSEGRAELYEINRTLSGLNTRFHISDEGITIEKLEGIAEAARFVLSYSQSGLTDRRGATLSAVIRGLSFDAAFVRALHPLLNDNTKELLNRFDYAGTTDLETRLHYRDGRWLPESLDLKLSDLAFSYKQFPYKVERLGGDFAVDAGANLRFLLNTRHDDPVKVRIDGDYANVFVDPVGRVRIQGEDVPIDAKLFNTFPETHRAVVQSLRPTGKINTHLLIELPPNDLPIRKKFGIGLNDVSVQYEKFPYPLQKISGMLYLDDETWTFENVIGTNESAAVRCSGHLKPIEHAESPEKTMEFRMLIRAEELPVDGQLSEALLDSGHRELLSSLRAKGKIDLDANVRFLTSDHRLELEFLAIPRAEFSIFPVRFPYRIENLQGAVYYKDGVVSCKQLTGNNRETRLRAGVLCQFASNGHWMMRLDPLNIDHLPSNRELLDALPSNVQGMLENLQISKPFNMSGLAEFSKSGENAPFRTVWDVGVVLHQNDAVVGVPIRNIFGKVRLTGYSENTSFQLAGDLKLDSATVRGFQVTDLTGPFFYDGKSNRIYIGQRAGSRLPPPPNFSLLPEFCRSPWFAGTPQARPVFGRIFDGNLFCEGLVVLDGGVSYSVNTHLIGADLRMIARETEPTAQKIAGTMNLRTHLAGNGVRLETLGGSGAIELRNANIYEAPGMIRLLRELSIREVDPNAGTFSSADIDFRIQGKRVVLNSIVFEGGAFSLTGDGEMQMDTRNVNLIMKTRLGNRRTQIPIVSDILGGAGDQIVQLNVHGPISDPTVTRVALPEIQRAIRQIQGEDTNDYGNFRSPEAVRSEQPPPRSAPSKLFPWR